MKTKISNKLYLIVLAIFLVTSCDSFLDMPDEGRIPQEEFYSDDDYAVMSVYAVYDMMQDLHGIWWNNLMVNVTMPTDEVNAGGGGPSDQAAFQELSKYTFDAGNGNIANVYSVLYSVINRANVVLENVDGDSDVKIRARADAKCIRAYAYTNLVMLWGRVPLVTGSLASGQQPSQASSADIWAQVETDLTEAIADLPEKYDAANSERWRVSKETAQLLLGKAHVYQEEYSDAIPYLQAIVDGGTFALPGDFSLALRKSTEFGTGSLFEVSFDDTYLTSNGDFTWGNTRTQETNVTWQLCGPRDVNMGGTGIQDGWGFMTPKQEAWDAFIDAGDIVRRKARIMNEEELNAAGGSFNKTDGNIDAYDCEGFIRLAYAPWASESGGDSWSFGTNGRILRYSDCLLLLAEAYANSGNSANAQTYLNMVRTHVSLPNYDAATDGSLDDAILSERQREFMFEGHRWFDVVRAGKGEELFGHMGFVSGKHELFPIPQSAIDANANLTQNPGW